MKSSLRPSARTASAQPPRQWVPSLPHSKWALPAWKKHGCLGPAPGSSFHCLGFGLGISFYRCPGDSHMQPGLEVRCLHLGNGSHSSSQTGCCEAELGEGLGREARRGKGIVPQGRPCPRLLCKILSRSPPPRGGCPTLAHICSAPQC